MSQSADELFEAAQTKSEAGDKQGALSLYLESLALDRNNPATLYNIALIYKYRRDWKQSLRYNLMSVELRPNDEATNWNTGIAATALRQWRVARDAWRRAGLKVDEGDSPIEGKFGFNPMRLNAFNEAEAALEVVWADRISPVTAIIRNIPTPSTRFRYGDAVLHDGAENGTRFFAPGDERSVFDVFELFERSDLVTYDVSVVVRDEAAIQALASACEAAHIEMEDWTSNIKMLCKACSEGRAHDQHDHSGGSTEWQTRRRIGLASADASAVSKILDRWSSRLKGRRVESIEADSS